MIEKKYDVAVIGGNFRAVLSAVEAAKNGAEVYLIAPRPRLGDDIAGTLMLDAFTGDLPDWDKVGKKFVSGAEKALPHHFKLKQRGCDLPKAKLTPNYVKYTLDDMLIKNNVRFITSSFVSRIIHLNKGGYAVMFHNRSGKNIVLAKTVIDCSDSTVLAADQGVEISPFQPGKYRFAYYLLSGNKPALPENDLKEFSNFYYAVIPGWDVKAPAGFPQNFKAYLFRCEADFELKSDSPFVLAEIDSKFRNLTFDPLQADRGEQMIPITPLREVATKASLNKAARKGYYYCAPAAERFLLSAEERKSGYAMRLNATALRLGKDAADSAKKMPDPLLPSCEIPSNADNLERISEIGLKDNIVFSTADTESLPVLGEADLIVTGGGTCGSPAAIAAARQGVKVIVCEYHYNLGGQQTVGLLGHYWEGNRVGFTQEIDNGVAKLGSILSRTKSEYYRREIESAGGKILYGTMVTGVTLGNPENGKTPVTGVVVITDKGVRGVLLTKRIIDATGNADVAAAAGAPTLFGGKGEESILLQGTSINWRDIGSSCVNSEVTYVDERNADAIHQALLQTQRDYGTYRWDFVPYVGSRERRHIKGDFEVKMYDLARDKQYSDTITVCRTGQDSHGPFDTDMLFFTTVSGARKFDAPVPYRCLFPAKISGMLVTGLGISAERDALAVMRMQADLQNEGYAAGYAAAMSIKKSLPLDKIPVRELQKHLVEKGILDAAVLTQTDTPPKTEKELKQLLPSVVAADNPNLNGIWDFYAAGDTAVRVLKKTQADNPFTPGSKEALHFAILLCAFHIPGNEQEIINYLTTPVDVPLPQEKGKEKEPLKYEKRLWDNGLTSAICYGQRNSWKDQAIIALAFVKCKKFAPILANMMKSLPDETEFSHLRAIAIYLDAVPDKSCVNELARILNAIKGHAQTISPGDYPKHPKNRMKPQIRELMTARCLYLLGDKDHLAENVLKSYLNDPVKIYAEFAKKALSEGVKP